MSSANIDARLDASLQHWKTNLLDLTKRNRALNFRPARVSTVMAMDEQPAEVFRQLCLERGSMKFTPAPDLKTESEKTPASDAAEPAEPIDNGADPQPGLFDDLSFGAAVDFVPYELGTLEDRYTDDVLQTTATAELLDRSLRRLDEQARLSIDEQGVNTLFLALGMLHYREAPGATTVFHAPLVLVPAQLTRKSARVGYVVEATDDDPLVNPALAEWLRRNFTLDLPELPDSASLPDDYDLQAFLQATRAAVAGQPNWAVKTEICLALFSFQKLVMYKDLQANGPALKRHRLVEQLITREGSAILGLPTDVQAMELDRDFAPERTFQVVDADSSQLRALAALTRGYDMVIEGPPGTGKSQTITNLIAQALAARKSVLFVAEKMAALQVVYRRLVQAGLGEFCLELHSTKANKRAVMAELRAALDASLQAPAVPHTLAGSRLPAVRHSLTDYANAVHAPHGSLGISPFQAYGELGQVRDAPRLKYTGPADTVTREQLDQALRELNDLAIAGQAISVPKDHPWRNTTKTYYSEDDLEAVGGLARDLLKRLGDIVQQARVIEAALNLPPIQRFADIETAALIASVIARSPGAPLAVLDNEVWNAPPAAAQALVERVRSVNALKASLARNFATSVFEQDVAGDIAYVEQRSHGVLSFLAILDARYRDIRQRWRALRMPHYRPSMLQQARDLAGLVKLRQAQQALAADEGQAHELFGALWQGDGSAPEALESYIRWVVEFRAMCVRHGLRGRALETASTPAPDVSNVAGLQRVGADAQATLQALRAAVGWPEGYLQDASFQDLGTRVFYLDKHLSYGPRWATFEAARVAVVGGLAAELLVPAMAGEVPFEALAAAFRRAIYLKWVNEVVKSRPPLRAFSTLTHEQRVEEFRHLDQRVLAENRIALVSGLREEVQRRLQAPEAAAAMPFLRRELARQRGLSPLRKTMKHASAAIRAIKPCLMMSPLSVAQLLEGGEPSFDLVIFDEASQLPTEDAVGAIARGRQLAVVGDPKQLPPTNFFSVISGQVTAPEGDDGLPLYEDGESVLEEYLGAGVPASRLKWHYRSAHESLIAFSNVTFYDADLYTFPSPDISAHTGGLQFEFVPRGVYEGKGLNAAEARRVADAVVEHAKTHPELSLGVGTFNLRQQLAIQDELEQRRRQDPSLEPFLARKEQDEFFVKNLENIQGDERDVIFISITYAKGLDGRLRYNFGPLNTQNGWRRLNVLITRARKLMRVFSSMHGEDINPVATATLGPRLLRDFLIYAEHGRLDSPLVRAAAETESPFEQDVFAALTRHNVQLVPQVGVSGYRIDFGVLDPEVPGRFVCGIECDGVAYHAAQTARDRDRLRQQVLEARGWTIHRVWSTDWFKDRQGQIERLLKLIAESRERASHEAAMERESRAQTAVAEAPLAESGEADDEAALYERPVVPDYRVAPVEAQYASDILAVPEAQIRRAIQKVVEIEAPLHQDDLVARVAGMWSARAGSRIRARITNNLKGLVGFGKVAVREPFVYRPGGTIQARTRSGTKIPPEHVAPEEYRAVVLLVLGTGHSFMPAELANEVRAVLGFGRTPGYVQQAVDEQLRQLIDEKIVGEGSLGLTLRG